MAMDAFEPKVDDSHEFAVATPIQGGGLCIVQTYETRSELAAGFLQWKTFASQRGITEPYPIQIINETMKCKILREMLNETGN